MEAHREAPPAGLWDGIERAMDSGAEKGSVMEMKAPASVTEGSVMGRSASGMAGRSRRRRMLYWGTAVGAAATIAALVFMIGGDGLTDPDPTTPATMATTVTPATIAVPALPASSTETVPTSTRVTIPTATVAVVPPASTVTVTETETMTVTVTVTADTDTNPKADIKTNAGSDTDNSTKTKIAQTQVQAQTPATLSGERHEPSVTKNPVAEKEAAFDLPNELRKTFSQPKKKRWKAALYASNISSGVTAANPGTSEASSINCDFSSIVAGVSSTGYMMTSREPIYSDFRHRQPLTVGVSVSYGLGERWSLVSGVTYTMLSSRSQAADIINRYSREQILHYIGIPLNLNYDVWQGRRLSFYLSGGGHVEKSISGTMTHTQSLNGVVESEQKDAISDRLQWSLNGSVGAQYDFVKNVGLYVEPGVNYYFDNKSGIETIYKAKPFNFGLRLGLRFSL